HASREKQHQPEDIQELLRKLLKILQIISEELAEYTNSPSWNCPAFYDDDNEYTIQYRVYLENSSNAITPDLPTEEPDNSLSMGDEHLSTIPETESDKVIKSSVEDLVTSQIFSDFNDDCTSSDDDSFEDIDYVEASPPDNSLSMGDEHPSTIPEKETDKFIKSSVEDLIPIPSESEDTSESDNDYNVKIYSNPLFEFDDKYISSNVNPLFDEVLEDIECNVSYDSNLDEPALLVTPLFDYNEDECLVPVDEIEFLLDRDPSTPPISIVSILEGFTDEPPLEENNDLFDLETKGNEWMKILYDAPIDDLMTEDKVFE
ncbi:hypothetical protein Tco_1199013, partial [Tanacetum coccineum]